MKTVGCQFIYLGNCFLFSCILAAFFFMFCIRLSALMILMLGDRPDREELDEVLDAVVVDVGRFFGEFDLSETII